MPELKPHRLIGISTSPARTPEPTQETPFPHNINESTMDPKDTMNPMNVDKNLKKGDKSWYGKYYDSSWRWIEDTYLKYFGENRTSYGVKDTLHKTEITGNDDVSGIQRSVGDAVGNLVSSKGPAGAVGDGVDKNVLRGNM